MFTADGGKMPATLPALLLLLLLVEEMRLKP